MDNEKAIFEAIDLVASLAGVSFASLTIESSATSLPEWDSLVHMELISALEGRLRIEMSSNQMATIGTIRGIGAILASCSEK